jgi:hypothetical protein
MTHFRPLKSAVKAPVAEGVGGILPSAIAKAAVIHEKAGEGWGGDISRVLKPPLG